MAHAAPTHWEQEILFKLDHLHRKVDANRDALAEIQQTLGILYYWHHRQSATMMGLAQRDYEEEGTPNEED